MRSRDTTEAYGSLSIVNHWLLAVVVLGLLATGVLAGEFLEGQVRGAILMPHKAVGVVALALVVWSVVWRLVQPARPEAIPGTPPREAVARRAMHGFLLLATAALSLSGIAMALFKGKGIDMFNLFTIPGQAEVPWLAGFAHEVHVVGGWLLLLAVLGHVAVAFKHHLVDHDATFARIVGKGA